MLYFRVNNLIYDEHLRVIKVLSEAQVKELEQYYQPLTKKDAKCLLANLWIETFALTHTDQEVSDAITSREIKLPKTLDGESYEYKLRLLMQINLCKPGCKKQSPHIHVTKKRRDFIIRERFPRKGLI